MDYYKITFELTPNEEIYRDILVSSLADTGFESFVENEQGIEAYVSKNQYNKNIVRKLDFTPLFSFEFTVELIPDRNWNEEWEQNYFKPLLIANKCLVRAPFHHDYPSAEIELIIEPKMAFGTGNHETTSLMVELILETEMKGKNILDMGCGTGILAMIASKQGAKTITAIDIDNWSYEATIENCKLNNCFNVTAYIGDSSLLKNENYDIIFANIHKNVLLNDMYVYNSMLNKSGLLFMSGFYETDLTVISEKARLLGLSLKVYKSKNNWVAACFGN